MPLNAEEMPLGPSECSDEQRLVASFNGFELDLTSYELRRLGSVIPLQRQPAALLALLLRRQGEYVTRHEIRRYLWKDNAVDADAGINYAICQIRRVCEPATPSCLETRRGFGYRWVGTVNVMDRNGHERMERSLATPLWRKAVRCARAAAIASTILLFAGTPREAAHPIATTIAFAEFENLTDNVWCSAVARAVEKSVGSAARKVDPHLGVVHRTVSPTRTASSTPAPAYLVTGSVWSQESGHQVTLRAVRLRDGAVVWTHSTDSRTAMQQPLQIASRLVKALRSG